MYAENPTKMSYKAIQPQTADASLLLNSEAHDAVILAYFVFKSFELILLVTNDLGVGRGKVYDQLKQVVIYKHDGHVCITSGYASAPDGQDSSNH